MGLRPVGDSAILAVRPALLLPWEAVRAGCSEEPFLHAKGKSATTSGMNPRTSKITEGTSEDKASSRPENSTLPEAVAAGAGI